jgi:CDP-diglyceride synthetase
MSRNVGWLGLIIGIVCLLIAIFAAQLGLGGTTWGMKHIVVLAVGVVLIAGGLFTALRPSSAS